MPDTSVSRASVHAIATKNDRVCPLPQPWNRLYDLLPGKSRAGGGWSPALPLILAAWDASTDAMKRERFLEHLDWAASHGALDAVAAFLEGLPEEQWLHLER